MPSPSAPLTTQRPDLEGSLMEFDLAMDRQNFIAHRMFRVKGVPVQAGTFGRIPIEQLLQTKNTVRAPRSGYQRGNWNFTQDSWKTERNGWEEAIDDSERAMYEYFFDAEVVATIRAQDFIARNAEIRVKDKMYDATVFTGIKTTNATANWSSHATATPIEDVKAAKIAVWDRSGVWPNAIQITRKQLMDLQLCDQIIAAAKTQNFQDVRPGEIGAAHLRAVFDLEFVHIANVAQNTANQGQAAAISGVWPETKCQVFRQALTDDHQEPCLGRTFHWNRFGQIEGRVETYREEQTESDIVRVKHDTQERLMYEELGHVIDNIG